MRTRARTDRNVIVILTDSLRADHLGCYGNRRIKTPNLDRLASEGGRFTQAYAEGMPTLPVRTALFTGRFTLPFRGWQRVEPTDRLLAEILWNKGMASALVTDTYHMHKPAMGYGRGFDTVRWIRGQEGDPYRVDPSIRVDVDRYYKGDGRDRKVRQQLEQYLRNRADWEGEDDHFVAQVVRGGLEWIEARKARRGLFLWLDCFDPHEPWDPPPPYNRMYFPQYRGQEIIHPIPGEVEGYLTEEELEEVRALYAGEVTLVDRWVGRFLDEIRSLGLYETSLIIHLSDHGEPLGEHRIVRKARPWPYEELSHIPLIVRHPEGQGRGKAIDAFVHTPDVTATILDFLGVPRPAGMHGRSLLPLLSGERETQWDFAVSGYHRCSWSLRTKEWTCIRWLPRGRRGDMGYTPWTLGGTRGAPETPELYHRPDDPLEQRNVIEAHGDLARDLDERLRSFLNGLA